MNLVAHAVHQLHVDPKQQKQYELTPNLQGKKSRNLAGCQRKLHISWQ